jgi:hypothetical protein
MGQTKATVSEQGGISGERKEVDVKDYPKAAAIGQILKYLGSCTIERAIH